MPTLKQLTCSIEVGHNNTKLKEYERIYRDGGVQCFVAVPNREIPFSIHLSTQGWIAPGLAMFVFIDGEYQCNRNKRCASLPGGGGDEANLEFRVRQKEEKLPNGKFIGRDWNFTELRTGMLSSHVLSDGSGGLTLTRPSRRQPPAEHQQSKAARAWHH